MKKYKSTILVTGGAGFIGSHVAQELIDLDHQVVVLDDLSGGFQDNIPLGTVFVQGSITDVPLLQAIFNQYKFDYVFHLAAYAAEGLSHFIKRFNYMNNVVGSVNLINESVKHQVKCFVFTSSIAVYGDIQPPLHEGLVPFPQDSYGIAKYAVEMELKASKEIFGLEYIIFRPHNVYGEKQHLGDKYRNVVGIFMNNIMQGLPLNIFGDGNQIRAFSHVGNVAPLIARSIENRACYGETFNIGAEEPVTVNQLAKAVMQAMGRDANIRYVPERCEPKVVYASHQKINAFFGKQPQIPLEEGLSRMAQWALKIGFRESKKFENIEIFKNLPSVWAE